jgi:hypothetical protein
MNVLNWKEMSQGSGKLLIMIMKLDWIVLGQRDKVCQFSYIQLFSKLIGMMDLVS